LFGFQGKSTNNNILVSFQTKNKGNSDSLNLKTGTGRYNVLATNRTREKILNQKKKRLILGIVSLKHAISEAHTAHDRDRTEDSD
jgi:hypothetical protein